MQEVITFYQMTLKKYYENIKKMLKFLAFEQYKLKKNGLGS